MFEHLPDQYFPQEVQSVSWLVGWLVGTGFLYLIDIPQTETLSMTVQNLFCS